jgi:hypothetical protein
MKCIIWTAWFDMHCAHTDPFKGGGIHGHLWRVRLGKNQDLQDRADIRILLGQAKRFSERLDHTDLGTISTEDIAVMALEKTDSDIVQVEEVGICLVELAK